MNKKAVIIGGFVLLILFVMPKVTSKILDQQIDKFTEAVNFLIDQLEGVGKAVAEKNDAGGLTKFGIDARSHPGEDIVHLTRERAIQIYLEEYWQKANLNLIPSNLQLQHFCGIVVMGISGHSKVLQRAAGVYADGDIGPISLAALQFVTPNRVADFERSHYDAIIDATPTNEVFRAGWYNRITKTLDKQTEINNSVAGIQKLLT